MNRAIATMLGGALGVAAHRLASLSGEKVEVVILGLSVFLIGNFKSLILFYSISLYLHEYQAITYWSFSILQHRGRHFFDFFLS